MAARRHEEGKPIDRLNLSLLPEGGIRDERLAQEAFLRARLEGEYDSLSITKRTFAERIFITNEVGSSYGIARELLELRTARFTELSTASTDTLEEDLINIGLLTVKKAKMAKGLVKDRKITALELPGILTDLAREELNKLEAGINKFETSQDAAFISFIDKYVNPEGREVLRYGMEVSPALVADVNAFNDEVVPAMGERGALDSLASLSQSSSKKSKKSNKSKVSEDTNNFIHFVELCLFKQALSDIEEGKSVLVETFARDDSGQIVFDTDHEFESVDGAMIAPPEIHTILLYKIPGTEQVAIVDPSNSTYTKHFVLGHNKVLIEYLAIECGIVGEGGISIVAPSKEIQIYKHPFTKQPNPLNPEEMIYIDPDKPVGPNANQARDCIDIAVKLAFEIMVHEGEPLDGVDSLYTWAPIVRITNNINIDPSILASKSVVRIKQSSDDSIRYKFGKSIEKLIKLLKLSKITENDAILEMTLEKESEIIDLIRSESSFSTYEELLKTSEHHDSLNSIYIDLLNNIRVYLQEEEAEMLGLLINEGVE